MKPVDQSKTKIMGTSLVSESNGVSYFYASLAHDAGWDEQQNHLCDALFVIFKRFELIPVRNN